MVEEKTTNWHGWRCFLARAVVRPAVAFASGAECRWRAAWLDAGSGWAGAYRAGGATGMAPGAKASSLESAQQASTHVSTDRARAGGPVRDLDNYLCLHC